MNFGSVGIPDERFPGAPTWLVMERLVAAQPTRIYPLEMHVTDAAGGRHTALALNEVSLFRATYQAVKVEILVDGETRLDELICDGVLLATPAGSSAYNLSAHGPIIPITAPLLALTPISPFRPRLWRGAILSNRAVVTFRTKEADKRPVSAVADNVEFKHVVEVEVRGKPGPLGNAAVRPRLEPRGARADRAVPLLTRACAQAAGKARRSSTSISGMLRTASVVPAKADMTPRAAARASSTFCSDR